MCCNNTVSNAWGCGRTGSTPTTTATTMTARVLEVRCDSPAGVRLLHLPAGTGEHRQRLLCYQVGTACASTTTVR